MFHMENNKKKTIKGFILNTFLGYESKRGSMGVNVGKRNK